jgi:hypothetical protein
MRRGCFMSHERGQTRFRGAMLAIVGMVAVSGGGAMFSYVLIQRSFAATSFAAVAAAPGPRDLWHYCPDDAVDRLVAAQLFQDVADWTGLETADQDSPNRLAFLDPIETAEIVFPLLTLLVVVSTAQRLAEIGPKHPSRNVLAGPCHAMTNARPDVVRGSPQMQHRLPHEAPVEQLPRHGADLGPRRFDFNPRP